MSEPTVWFVAEYYQTDKACGVNPKWQGSGVSGVVGGDVGTW
jgi:hypothetical protein